MVVKDEDNVGGIALKRSGTRIRRRKNVNNIDIDRNYSTGKLYAKGRKNVENKKKIEE